MAGPLLSPGNPSTGAILYTSLLEMGSYAAYHSRSPQARSGAKAVKAGFCRIFSGTAGTSSSLPEKRGKGLQELDRGKFPKNLTVRGKHLLRTQAERKIMNILVISMLTLLSTPAQVISTHLKLLGPKARVVSVKEKAKRKDFIR
ncbi:MAG: hypothetical protein R6U39_12080 [Candidatus Aegiribacteria sp.]